MEVEINGEAKAFDEGTSVETMLGSLAVPRHGIAVEINREIIPRRAHAGTVLKDGDAVEIVTFVGGG